MGLKLRKEVAAFAELMEKRLRIHETKGGWRGMEPRTLTAYARNNLQSAEKLLREREVFVARFELTSFACNQLADVANYAMMAADVLMERTPPKREGD